MAKGTRGEVMGKGFSDMYSFLKIAMDNVLIKPRVNQQRACILRNGSLGKFIVDQACRHIHTYLKAKALLSAWHFHGIKTFQ